MNQAVIGVGSNIAPWENIAKAKDCVARQHSLQAESSFITTSPIGFSSQDDFVNGAFLLETRLDFDSLRQSLKQIEKDLGRARTSNKYGPRTIDLDIVVWNGEIVDDDFYERDFLRNAVLELMPNLLPSS